MRCKRILAVFALALTSGVLVAPSLRAESAAGPSGEVLNFALLDSKGKIHELRRADGQAVVLYFTGNGCPVARKSYGKLGALRDRFSEQGVVFWAVNANAGDDRSAIEKEHREFGPGGIPVLVDDAQGVARLLGVRRTGEAVAIRTSDWKVIYRGAIDDQLVEGAEKPSATEHYLAKALEQHLAGQPVTQQKTVARGCAYHFETAAEAGQPISYAKQVAPLLEKKCAQCHTAGGIGPWAMSSHKKVKGMSDMIQETLLTRRMPPWDADSHYGKFIDDRSLTVQEKRLLLEWVEQGAPKDEGEDPLLAVKPAAATWPGGQPDAILTLPKEEEIPATGVLDYRHITVASPYTNDVWLGGITFKPGNMKVVHHIILRAKFEGGGDDGSGRGIMIGGWAPGATPFKSPEGTGIKLGKNAQFDFEMHYTTMGAPQKDRSEIGLYVMAEKPERAYIGGGAFNTDFSVAPTDGDSRTFAMHNFKKDSLIHAMTPHMHMRGSWMKYEVLYPDGKRETLLSVPRYDFNWQVSYTLVEPKRVPAGTWLLCTGGFDNSKKNPSNPDASKRIHWGEQSWDEMFIGFFGASEVPKAKPEKGTAAK